MRAASPVGRIVIVMLSWFAGLLTRAYIFFDIICIFAFKYTLHFQIFLKKSRRTDSPQ